ncbi:MAG: TIGR04282 family arsenosugar biosynthesis glycosyltransferase [Thiotrichales bacterium]|nr:TIGR04282 family arsenosugar biosynthesis glycosyltransferase [Thiotrichales bacterium]
MSDACRVVVMARAPVPGETKRRLIPAIGGERAAALHRAMIRCAVETALAAGTGPVELWCTPDTGHAYFRGLRDRTGVALHAQVGADLGQRMHDAIAARPGATLVIGTDCPFLQPDDLVRAASALRSAIADVVIVPALDGGYVLVAVGRPRPELFTRVDWGTERVLAQTRECARTARLRVLELEARRDIDRPEDLDALAGILDW